MWQGEGIFCCEREGRVSGSVIVFILFSRAVVLWYSAACSHDPVFSFDIEGMELARVA